MPLKRLVTSAAILVLGCSDAATDGGIEVPEFSGPLPPALTGAPPGNGSVDTNAPPVVGSTDGAGPDTATNGTDVNGSQGAGQPSNEGQNAGDVPLANEGDNSGNNNSGNNNSGSAGTPGTDQGTSTPVDGQNGGAEQPPGGVDQGGDDGTPVTEVEPPPEEPPPVVYPALDCNAPPPTLTAGNQACAVNASGNVDGQSWFMWYSGQNGCMTPYAGAGGAFRANWNNSGDFLARMGIQWDETQTFDQLGTIGADLRFTKTGSAGGYSFIGIYGWSNDPLVEYYIVENSYGNGPAVPFGGTQRGTANVDGATYRIYTAQKNNQPSIHGTANFTQVFSVRQSPRECGHVSISQHFQQWQGMGINLGKMYEARVLVEAGGGSGSIDFQTARVTASTGN